MRRSELVLSFYHVWSSDYQAWQQWRYLLNHLPFPFCSYLLQKYTNSELVGRTAYDELSGKEQVLFQVSPGVWHFRSSPNPIFQEVYVILIMEALLAGLLWITGHWRSTQLSAFFSPQWQDSRAKGSNFLITGLLQWHSGLTQQTPSISHLFSIKGTYQRLQELQALNTKRWG